MSSFCSLQRGLEYSCVNEEFYALDDLTFSPMGVVPPIAIPHANIIKYVLFFDSMFACQQSIESKPGRRFRMLLSDQNLIDWDRASFPTTIPLAMIFVFCRSLVNYDQMNHDRAWHQHILNQVVLPDRVDHLLLDEGLAYIRTIMNDYLDTPAMYNKFVGDANVIITAVGFGIDAQIAEIDAQLSQEAQ